MAIDQIFFLFFFFGFIAPDPFQTTDVLKIRCFKDIYIASYDD